MPYKHIKINFIFHLVKPKRTHVYYIFTCPELVKGTRDNLV